MPADWPRIRAGRGTAYDEAPLRKTLMQATYAPWTLCAMLFAIGWLGVARPGVE